MKRFVVLSVAITCLAAMTMPGFAEEGAAPKKKVKAPKVAKVKKEKKPKVAKPKPVLEELTIAGNIARQEKKGKNDKVSVKYVLTDTKGNKIPLPKPKAPRKKKGEEANTAINLDDYLDVGVKVTGQGTRMDKKGKTIIRLKKITGIEKGGSVAEIKVFPSPWEVG